MLAALIAYAWMSGWLTATSRERAAQRPGAGRSPSSAEAIRKNPTDGGAYAVRAETLFSSARRTRPIEVLDQGEKAVKGENPALLYILRATTQLLNAEKAIRRGREGRHARR